MHILSTEFLDEFSYRVLNPHPALPGKFPGAHAIDDAFAAFQRGEVKETGVMVHLVPDEQVDAGPVIASRSVPIYKQDTLDTLTNRIHGVEHQLLVFAIQRLAGESRAMNRLHHASPEASLSVLHRCHFSNSITLIKREAHVLSHCGHTDE